MLLSCIKTSHDVGWPPLRAVGFNGATYAALLLTDTAVKGDYQHIYIYMCVCVCG